MPYSRTDLINRALRELKVLAAGQAASAEDAKTIEESLAGVQAYLQAAEVGSIDFDTVAEEDYIALAQVVAFANAQAFNLQGQELSDLGALSERGEKRLQYVRRGAYAQQTIRHEFF